MVGMSNTPVTDPISVHTTEGLSKDRIRRNGTTQAELKDSFPPQPNVAF
jgi:hypothetical protein